MESQAPARPKFDPVKIITQALSLMKHVRLMFLMLSLGVMAGMIYYVYSRPLYQARSLIYLRSYGTPVRTNTVDELRSAGSALNRMFLKSLFSAQTMLKAAQRLQLVGPSGTSEDVSAHVPAIRYEIIDTNHIEISVLAFDADVVKKFAEAMVEEYKALQDETWVTFRNEALARYGREVANLEQQIDMGRSEMLKKERDSKLTEVTITQKSLTSIPEQLVETRERLKKMDEIQQRLLALNTQLASTPATDDLSGTVETLSLLSGFEKETEVNVGSVVRSPGAGARPTVTSQDAKISTDVIVQPSMVNEMEPWRELEKARRLLLEEIGEKARTYLPNHAVMRDLSARLLETERGLKAELEVARQRFDLELSRLRDKQVTLQERLPEYHEATEVLDRSAYDYNTLAQGQQIWDKARDQLADKLAAVTFNENRDWVDLQFKGHVFLRDDVPVSPNKMKVVMLSLVVGLAGAFGAPVLLNMLNTSVSTIHDLEEYTGLTGIGMVPLARKELLEDVHRSPAQGAAVPNFLLETIRVIRSNICLRPNRQHRSQVIMVTSARPQEGKTSQAANLAWAFRSMGERTLLLDCDLRRGRIHGFTGVPNDLGMTHLLIGDCLPEDAIEPVGHESATFDVIPRGPVIAGTTEILCQKRFEDLMTLFRKHYDRIIVDTPPVLGLSETNTLQRVCDGVVLVVRAEATSRKDVGDAVTLLKKAGAHFFGFVLNAVDLNKGSNYFNYYYYSAAYYDDFDQRLDDEDNRKNTTSRRGRRPAQPAVSPNLTSGETSAV